MIMLNKADFFSIKLRESTYPLPNGYELPIRELTAAQRGRLRELANQGDPMRANAEIVVMGCPMFEPDDVDAILAMPGGLVTGIADAILELSGIGESAEDEAKNG